MIQDIKKNYQPYIDHMKDLYIYRYLYSAWLPSTTTLENNSSNNLEREINLFRQLF